MLKYIEIRVLSTSYMLNLRGSLFKASVCRFIERTCVLKIITAKENVFSYIFKFHFPKYSLFYCSVTKVVSDSFATPWTLACQVPLSMGFSQVRKLEGVAISFSKGFSQPRDWTCVACVSRTGRRILYHWATKESQIVSIISIKNSILTLRSLSE